jgi:predicted dehydrogenase
MSRIRIGVVGAGFGAIAHLPALRNLPRFEVVAIASPSKATTVAAESGIAAAFPSAQAMLGDCELDAVTVASPPFAHVHDVLAALSARKHVLCEKPFALDVSQARAMRDAGAAAGTVCAVAHEFRYVPQVTALKELVQNGHLGALRNIEATLLRSTLRETEHRPRSWWFERARGGGLAGAALSHMIDQANWLAGRAPGAAIGFLRTANSHRRDDRGAFEATADDGAVALLDYGDGALARLCADGTTAVESYTVAVHGEKRTAVGSGPTLTELALFAVDANITDELTCKASAYAAFARHNSSVPYLMELYDRFAAAIDGKSVELPTFDDALETQRVLEAIGYGA